MPGDYSVDLDSLQPLLHVRLSKVTRDVNRASCCPRSSGCHQQVSTCFGAAVPTAFERV